MAYRDEQEALRARAAAAERRASEAEDARRKAETEVERLRDALEESQREPLRRRPDRGASRGARALLVGFVASAIGVGVVHVLPRDPLPAPVVAPLPEYRPPPPMPSLPRATTVTVARWPLRVVQSDAPWIDEAARCELRGWVHQRHAGTGYLDRVALRCFPSSAPLADSGPGIVWGPPLGVGETADGALRYRFLASAPIVHGALRIDPLRLEVQLDGDMVGKARFAMITPWSEPERVELASRDAPRLGFDGPVVRTGRVVRARGRAPAPAGASCELVISPTTQAARCFAVVRCGDAVLVHDALGQLACRVRDGSVEVDSPRLELRGTEARVAGAHWSAALRVDAQR